MQHRIVILGAGYAGAFSAGYLARQLHGDDFEITVVNAEPDFVERLRLHQRPGWSHDEDARSRRSRSRLMFLAAAVSAAGGKRSIQLPCGSTTYR